MQLRVQQSYVVAKAAPGTNGLKNVPIKRVIRKTTNHTNIKRKTIVNTALNQTIVVVNTSTTNIRKRTTIVTDLRTSINTRRKHIQTMVAQISLNTTLGRRRVSKRKL
jgi:hypothetical protein